MVRRILFLLAVFATLLLTVIAVAWISNVFIFGKLEPAFLGALVAASGAIFAACIAYSAAIENVRLAQQAAERAAADLASNKRKSEEQELETKTREFRDLARLRDFVYRLLVPFENAQDRIGSNDYFDCYKNAERQGLLVPFLGSAPGDFPAMANDLTTRLANVRQAISQAEAVLLQTRDGPNFNREREQLSAGIKPIVEEARAVSKNIAGEMEVRQSLLQVLLSVEKSKLLSNRNFTPAADA